MTPCDPGASIQPGRTSRVAGRRISQAAGLLAVLAASLLATAAQRPGARAELLKTESLSLTTGDRVKLSATFYWPKDSGEDTPVVVLLHMFERDQRTWQSVAEAMAKRGLAAVTVDLRGHAKSTERLGVDTPLSPNTFSRSDYLEMVTQDMEAVKRELVRRHNKRMFNIERLGIAGAEMGASIAARWAYYDWTNAQGRRKDYPIVGGKRGRDVKALALFSPRYNFKGLRITQTEVDLMRDELAVKIFVGEEDRLYWRDAQRLLEALLQTPRSAAEVVENEHEHEGISYPTTLQGTDLFGKNLGDKPIEQEVVDFFYHHLAEELDVEWQERRTPFGLQPD